MECLVVRHTQSFYTELVILALSPSPIPHWLSTMGWTIFLNVAKVCSLPLYGLAPPWHLVFSFPAHLFLFLCFEFTSRMNLLKTLIPFLWGAPINADEALFPCLLLTSWHAAGFLTDHRPGPVPVHAWPRRWGPLLYCSTILHVCLFPTQPFLLQYQENRNYHLSLRGQNFFWCF